jgi:hypothetical protein
VCSPALECRASSLDVEAALPGGGRRAARDPRAWPHEGCGDQPANLGARVLDIAGLVAGGLARDDEAPGGVQPVPGQGLQADRAPSDSPSMASRFTRSSTLVATLFTFWPPGPEARTARRVSAQPGTRSASVTAIASLMPSF